MPQAKLNLLGAVKRPSPKAPKLSATPAPIPVSNSKSVVPSWRYAKRTRGVYQPGSAVPFRLSRTKLENCIRCPRCFYLDVRLGIKQPDSFPLTLNTAVDALLKKEFDGHRAKKQPHPLMTAYKVDAIPFSHPDLNQWRENFVGVQFLHQPTNLLIFGAVDDVWISSTGELIVVDYKATSKDTEVSIDAEWQDAYKRQMEIYQWLLRQNKFPVSGTGYFVYANGRKDRQAFDARLEFDITLIPYVGNDQWVEGVVRRAHALLNQSQLPPSADTCDYCAYRRIAAEAEK